MLTLENVQQIFDEHEVYARDDEAKNQHLDHIVFAIGEARARLLKRSSRLEDGVFAAWAVCLPSFPQPDSYSNLMRRVRKGLLTNVSSDEAGAAGKIFFADSLLRLEIHELGKLVTSPDAAEQIQEHLNYQPEETPVPVGGG